MRHVLSTGGFLHNLHYLMPMICRSFEAGCIRHLNVFLLNQRAQQLSSRFLLRSLQALLPTN